MIRVNLLKSLQPAKPLLLEDFTPTSRSRKVLAGILGITLLASAAGLIWWNVFQAESGAVGADAQAEIIQPPVRPQPAPQRVTADAVEDIVRDIQEFQRKNPPILTYDDLLPSEKVEFQYFAAGRILKQIQDATPQGVGFAHFIYTVPGDFYVHGLAYEAKQYEQFQQSLQNLQGAQIRPGSAGGGRARAAGREFSFYGSVQYPLTVQRAEEHVLQKSRVQAELQRFRDIASSVGVTIPLPKLDATLQAGPYQKHRYKVEARCDYRQLQRLIENLYTSKSHVGLEKLGLKAIGEDTMMADLHLTLYVN